ncbi:hypothetical protein [Bradyrhizobium sp. SZCCHNR1039]|uniref:hypothetical protein n=1 Tax=Bradyrhizobium sp. SZCCHNR1039 TaxID=3057350 RepID=UPI002916A404|nr:hypothetical protein [Bradyrhizobium sp. SZCCHNR1039]
MTLKTFLVGCFLAFLCLIAPHQLKAKEIDLSNMTDPTGVYNVAFCARPSPDSSGKPGHAFVAYSHANPDGDRDLVAIGHTVSAGVGPVSAAWSYFGDSVSGLLKEERYTSIKQNCLDVTVNKNDFNQARALAEDPLFKMGLTAQPGTVFEAYKLGLDDCMTFLISVAETLKSQGLKVPTRGATELPMAYIARFIAAN